MIFTADELAYLEEWFTSPALESLIFSRSKKLRGYDHHLEIDQRVEYKRYLDCRKIVQ